MNTYIISDLHIGHKNMALHRGFSSVEEHDETILGELSKLGKKSKLFILGDLTMEKKNYSWLDESPCSKEIILGNHDLPQHVPSILDCKTVTKVSSCVKYKGCILTHIPIHEMEMGRYRLNIHGHLHDELVMRHDIILNNVVDKRYVNVSAERLNWIPINIGEIISLKV